MKQIKNRLMLIAVSMSFYLISAGAQASDHTLKVMTSIKPIQLIAKAIASNLAQVDVLVPLGASPHDYRLKPSDVKKINQTDVMFWIGSDMETFLPKIISNTPHMKSIALIDQKEIHLQTYDQETSENLQSHDLDHSHDHNHSHGKFDTHIWLSPKNGIAIAQIMVKNLSELDPKNTVHYKKNYTRFTKQLKAIDIINKNKLIHVKHKPIFVFHDGYGYLKTHYNLNIAGYFTVNPEQKSSAKFLQTLREKIQSTKTQACIFTEPQFNSEYIGRLTQGLNVSLSELDPLASTINIDENSYAIFIQKMISQIANCLKK